MRIIIITLVFMLVDFCALRLWLTPPAQLLEPFYETEVQAVGRIEPLSVRHSSSSFSFVLDCEEIRSNNKIINYQDKVRVIYSGPMEPVRVGKVAVKGTLKELRGFANPGSFDSDTYNWVQGIGGLVICSNMQILDSEAMFMEHFLLLNLKLRKLVERTLPKEQSVVLNGMVLGGTMGLEEEIRESFSANGLSHLLSVSGTHLLLLVCFLKTLIKPLELSNQRLIIALALVFYALLCGLRPPVLRALGMSLVLLWGEGESPVRGRILCSLAMGLLIYKPVWLLDIGFQLSFGASAGLIWFLPTIKEKLEKYICFSKILLEGIAVTISAQLLTIPILVKNFYTIPLISVISNVLLVPLLEMTTILTIIGMAISLLCVEIGNIFFKSAAWILQQTLYQAQLLMQLPLAKIVIGDPPLVCIIIYYFLMSWYFDFSWYKVFKKRERAIIKYCCILIMVGMYFWQQWQYRTLTCYFLDVGQGDAAVVLADDKTIVVDTGGLVNFDTGSRILVPMLHSLGRSKIDLLFVSHGDYDHIGGGAGLARNMEIKHIVLPRECFREDELAVLKGLLKKASGCLVEYAEEGRIYSLGGAIFRIVASNEQFLEGNDASTLLELTFQACKSSILFTGDMSIQREESLVTLKKYDVLKVGHHGSKTSTGEAFLQQIKPKLAVISVGKGNKYGHPSKEVLQRLEDTGTAILRTDYHGCIKLEVLSKGIKWSCWRKAN